jgi:hypothetical protein
VTSITSMCCDVWSHLLSTRERTLKFDDLHQLLQMPAVSVDGSSAISESRKASVTSRDGGLCVLCGMDPVDVAHIVARKSGDHHRVSEAG